MPRHYLPCLCCVLTIAGIVLGQPKEGTPPYKRLLQGEDAKRAGALESKAAELAGADNYEDAIKTAAELLALRRRLQGDDHHEVLNAHWQLEALKKTAVLPRERREAWRAMLASVHQLGPLRRDARHAEAQALTQRLFDLHKEVLGDRHPDTAVCAGYLGVDLAAQGKHAEAERLYRQSLETCRELLGEGHPRTATSYANVASNLAARGQYAGAEPLFRKALQVQQVALGERHPSTLRFFHSLAAVLYSQAKYADAEQLLAMILEMRRQVLGERHLDTADSYNNLAVNLHRQGKFVEAEALYRQSLDVTRQVLGDGHPDVATSLSNLAAALLSQRKPAEAERGFRAAAAILQKTLGDKHPQTALCLANLGAALADQGKYADAEQLHLQALEINRQTLGEHHPDTAGSYNNLAMALAAQGKYAAAEARHREALALRRRTFGEHHLQAANSYHNLAVILKAQGKHVAALPLSEAAARGDEAARLRASSSGLGRAAFGETHSSTYELLAASHAQLGNAADAWIALESARGRGLLDEAVERRLPAVSPEESRRQLELTRRLDELAGRAVRLASKRQPTQQDQASLEELVRQRTEVEQELADLAVARSRREIATLERLQEALPANAAWVAWVDERGVGQLGRDVSEHWACVVKKTGAPIWLRLSGTGADARWSEDDQTMPARARQAITERTQAAPLLAALYRQRLAMLESQLADVQHLFVTPAGVMAGMPVEALTDRWTISYVPSATALAQLVKSRTTSNKGGRLLALGDPAFDATRHPPLPGSRREVVAIAALFTRPTVLLGSDASEQRLDALALSKELAQFDELHLATHGDVDHERLMRTALALAQDRLPDGRQEVVAGRRVIDGRVSAQEILDRWHLEADLVVLSACATGLGRKAGGEGFLGFSQALSLAGARSIVLSLWQVSDTATALLMVRFYENLLGKRAGLDKPMPKAEALREAKFWIRDLSMREIEERIGNLPEAARGLTLELPKDEKLAPGDKPFAHPFFWSAFILIGDPV